MLHVVDDIWYSHFLCICMASLIITMLKNALIPLYLVCVYIYIYRHRHQERYTHKTKTTCHTNLIPFVSLSLSSYQKCLQLEIWAFTAPLASDMSLSYFANLRALPLIAHFATGACAKAIAITLFLKLLPKKLKQTRLNVLPKA